MTKEQQNDKKSPATAGRTEEMGIHSQKRQPLAALSFFISMTALGLSGYVGWRTLNLEQNQLALVVSQEQLQTQLARQQVRLNEALEHITPIEERLSDQQSRSQRLLERTGALSRSVSELKGQSLTSWKLTEVESLLNLANQQLLMNNNTRSALSLLKSADSIFAELDNYTLYDVRSALAKDISLISTVPEFDLEGLYLQLDALSKQVNTLPLPMAEEITFKPEPDSVAEPVEQPPSPPDSTVTTTIQGWKRIILNVFHKAVTNFTSLFRFTPYQNKPVKGLTTPENAHLIRQNLQLLLEQSKLAVLSRHQAIYERSLQQAIDWINDHFSLSGTSQSTAMVSTLLELKEITVQPALPNITHALDALKKDHRFVPIKQGTPPVQKHSIKNAPVTENPDKKHPFIPEEEQPQ